jgi:flavin-binding protein dodecin
VANHKEPVYKTLRRHREHIEGPCLEALESACMNQLVNAIETFDALMDFEVGQHKTNVVEGATVAGLRARFAKKVGQRLKDPSKAYVFQRLLESIIEEAKAAKIKHDAKLKAKQDAGS